jgi:hypothetical protein
VPACGRCRRAAVRGRRGSRPRSVTRAAGLVGVARDGDRVANGSVVGIGLMAPWREYPDGIGGCGGEADDLAERRDKVVTGVFDLSRAQVERVSTAVPDTEPSVGDVAGGASPEKPEGVALRSPGVPPSVSVTVRRSMRISRAATAVISPPAALMSSPRWQLSTTRWPHDRRFSRGSARIRLLQRSFASAGLSPTRAGSQGRFRTTVAPFSSAPCRAQHVGEQHLVTVGGWHGTKRTRMLIKAHSMRG